MELSKSSHQKSNNFPYSPTNVRNPLNNMTSSSSSSQETYTRSSNSQKTNNTINNSSTSETKTNSTPSRKPIRGKKRSSTTHVQAPIRQEDIGTINKITLENAKDRAFSLAPDISLENLRAAETSTLSLSTYFLGFFRLIYVYAFSQAFLFGFAISVSIVLNSSFVTTRAFYWKDTKSTAIVWIFLTPLINIIFAWLLDEALDVMMDTLKHSPWVALDPLIMNDRQKYVYLSTGGHRPVLLNLRASGTALLCAMFVWPSNECNYELQGKEIQEIIQEENEKNEEMEDGDDGNDGNNGNENEARAISSSSSSSSSSNNKKVMSEIEPLFVPPDWIIFIVEFVFWSCFVIFPMVFAYYRGFSYNFTSIQSGLLVSVFIVALITCPFYAGMHLLVYCWPRAARIDAFLRGRSTAEFLWYPYFTNLRNVPVIGPPSLGTKAEEMERDFSLPFSRSARIDLLNQEQDDEENNNNNNNNNNSNALFSVDPRFVKQDNESVRNHEIRTRSILRMNVAGTSDLYGKRDVVYRSLDAWDRNRVNPIVLHAMEIEKYKKDQEVAAAIQLEEYQQQGKPSTVSTSHLRRRSGIIRSTVITKDLKTGKLKAPKLSKSLISEIMCITAAANMDESLNSFDTLGAVAAPGHLMWYKCLRYPVYKMLHSCSLDVFLVRVCCSKSQVQTEKKCYCFPKTCSNNWALLIVFFLYALIIGLSFVPGGAVVTQFAMAMVTAVFGYYLWQVMPAIIGRSFYAILLFQVIWQGSLSVGAGLFKPERDGADTQHVQDSGKAKPKRRHLDETIQADYYKFTHFGIGNSTDGGWPSPKWINLPICSSKWGYNKGAEVTILDAAFLANSIYEPDGGVLAATEVFRGGPLEDGVQTKFVRQFGGPPNNGPRKKDKSMIQWSRWDFNTSNTTVFVVRGTSNLIDALQDLSYYSIASSLKVVLQAILPIQYILPPIFIQKLIEFCVNDAFKPIEYDALLKEVKEVRNGLRKKPSRSGEKGGQVLIVGHSLGGAYAQIVGALGEIQTMSLSPPGLFYGIKKFGINNISQV